MAAQIVSKNIFITGVSSGIGMGAAAFFLKAGHTVIGTYRNKDSITELLAHKNFVGVALDVKDRTQIEKLPQQLATLKIATIDILVNNAGVAMAGPFVDQPFSEIEEIIQVNLLAVMLITQKLIPLLQQPGGRIINISSIAGQNGTPFLSAYCASKHAIEGFSESIRRELHLLGIKVILIGPGSIRTPIWYKGFETFKSAYSQSKYAKAFERFILIASNEEQNGLPVSAVVADIEKAALGASPKIRYAPIPKKTQNYYLTKLIPSILMDRLFVKILGLK